VERAAARFEAAGLPVDAEVARRWRGRLVGGAAGAEQVAASDRSLTMMGVVCPQRWSQLHVP
jgi:hypothetical protein